MNYKMYGYEWYIMKKVSAIMVMYASLGWSFLNLLHLWPIALSDMHDSVVFYLKVFEILKQW